jgi:eukaryotic-like serine/threonine-protein kinase
MLRRRYQGTIPPTLRADEAALFVHRIEQQFREACDSSWYSAGGAAGSGASAALTLLCALLGAERDQRPRHGLEISRLIAKVRASMTSEREPLVSSAARPVLAGLIHPLRSVR